MNEKEYREALPDSNQFIESQTLESKLYFLAMSSDGLHIVVDDYGMWTLTFEDGRVVVSTILEDALNVAMKHDLKEIDEYVIEIAKEQGLITS